MLNLVKCNNKSHATKYGCTHSTGLVTKKNPVHLL